MVDDVMSKRSSSTYYYRSVAVFENRIFGSSNFRRRQTTLCAFGSRPDLLLFDYLFTVSRIADLHAVRNSDDKF